MVTWSLRYLSSRTSSTEQEINDAYMRMASATLGHAHIGQAYANAKVYGLVGIEENQTP